MILELANQIRWEWFKLRRRWMPYILLAVLVLISQVALWATILAYNEANARRDERPIGASATSTIFVDCSELLDGEVSEFSAQLRANDPNVSQAEADEAVQSGVTRCQDWDERRQEDVQGLYDLITPPGSARFSLAMATSIGLVLIAILTASAIGTEHGWGTMRFMLVRGVRRWHVLASKLVMVWIAFVAALLVTTSLGAVSGQIIDGLLSGAKGFENSTSWGEVAGAFGRGSLSVLPYVAMVSAVTVAARSSAAGIGLGLGYYFLEQIVVGIFSGLFDWFSNVSDFLLVNNIDAYAASGGGVSLEGEISGAPSELHALLVMAAYALVAGALAFYLLLRRDVGGASRG